MNFKKLEYLGKDVPTLKKDLRLRITFAVLFIVAFIWQIVMLLTTAEFSTTMLVVSAITMIFSVVFGFTSILYAIKDLKILDKIKIRGKSISSVNFVFNIDKRSFVRLYSLITSVLALIALLLLVSCLTYSILSLIYYNTISFYLPAILAFVAWCFNSAWHLKNEIYTSQNVNKFNSIFY